MLRKTLRLTVVFLTVAVCSGVPGDLDYPSPSERHRTVPRRPPPAASSRRSSDANQLIEEVLQQMRDSFKIRANLNQIRQNPQSKANTEPQSKAVVQHEFSHDSSRWSEEELARSLDNPLEDRLNLESIKRAMYSDNQDEDEDEDQPQDYIDIVGEAEMENGIGLPYPLNENSDSKSSKTGSTGKSGKSSGKATSKDKLPFDPVDEAEMELGIQPETLKLSNSRKSGTQTRDKSKGDKRPQQLEFDPVDEAEMRLGIMPDSLTNAKASGTDGRNAGNGNRKQNTNKQDKLEFDPVDEAEMSLGIMPDSLTNTKQSATDGKLPKRQRPDSQSSGRGGTKQKQAKLDFDPVDEAEMELGIVPDSLATSKNAKGSKQAAKKTKQNQQLAFDPVDKAEMELGINPLDSSKDSKNSKTSIKASETDEQKKNRKRPHPEGQCSSDQIAVCGEGQPCSCKFAAVSAIDCSSGLRDLDKPASANICPSINMKSKYFLRKVLLSQNGITEIDRETLVPGYEGELDMLNLSFNLISEVPEDTFQHFGQLRTLSFQSNQISNLTERSFQGLSNLVELDLRHNNLKELRGNIFGSLENLKILLLDGNPLEHIDSNVFQGLKNLNMLSLDLTNLESIQEDWFEGLRKLHTLSLQKAQLNVVPPAIHHISTLEFLYLSGNPISEISENDFNGLSKLRGLYLNQMPELWFVDSCAFCGLPSLRELFMNSCPKLTKINAEAFGSKSSRIRQLEIVDLSKNALQSIDEPLLPWENVTTLALGHNPWQCNCKMQWFSSAKFQKIADNPSCAEGSRFGGMTLQALSSVDFCSGKRVPLRLRLIVASITVAFVIIMLFIIYCLYRGSCRLKRLRVVFSKRHNVQYAYRNLTVKAEAEDQRDDVLLFARKKQNSTGEEHMASI